MDIDRIRRDFPMLKQSMEGHPLVYLDNAATSLKPQSVIDEITRYYTDLSFNAHRGDNSLSYQLDVAYEASRQSIADFIGASRKEEVVFTSGTTASLNLVAIGFGKRILKAGDEILISEAEHASNILPWFQAAKETGAVVKFIPLDDEGKVTFENTVATITENTKIISLAHITNVLGSIIPMKEIVKYAHERGIFVVCDGAQSVPHIPVDVVDLDVDFMAFSAHKMCGPTGIGVLYGKLDLLSDMDCFLSGGGMNARFNTCGEITYKQVPFKFESGTQHIDGILGFKAAVDYLSSIGMEKIEAYEEELKLYAVSELEKLDFIELYNKNTKTGNITFNIKGLFPQDTATYLNSYGIAVRTGLHCAKLLTNYLKVPGTVRASLYFYNNKEEVDRLIDALKAYQKEDVLSWLT